MILTVQSPVFIDRLSFRLNQPQKCRLKAVLKDDHGSIQRAMETELSAGQQVLEWEGLDDLPYGEYTLEIKSGSGEIRTRMVKRV